MLPPHFNPGARRDRIRSINFQIKDVVAEMNNNVIYIDTDQA